MINVIECLQVVFCHKVTHIHWMYEDSGTVGAAVCCLSSLASVVCVLFVKAPLVQRDRGRSLTAAVVDLVVLGDVTCVGSVRTSAIKRVKTLTPRQGFEKHFFICATACERFKTDSCTLK